MIASFERTRDTTTLRQAQEARWGKSAQTLAEEVWRDAAPTVTRCGLCRNRVIHRGSAVEGREAARVHRLESHPEVRRVKRRRVKAVGA